MFLPLHLSEKAKQAAAYLDGGEAENPKHPDHLNCVRRALSRAKDIMTDCKAYLEDIETHLLSGGETELDELPLEDMLYHFGHEALGLSIQDALEIDPHYRRRLENPI